MGRLYGPRKGTACAQKEFEFPQAQNWLLGKKEYYSKEWGGSLSKERKGTYLLHPTLHKLFFHH